MSNVPHILAAAQQMHETVKYIPMTAKDAVTAKDAATAKEAGIFAGIAAAVIAVLQVARTGGRKPATSK